MPELREERAKADLRIEDALVAGELRGRLELAGQRIGVPLLVADDDDLDGQRGQAGIHGGRGAHFVWPLDVPLGVGHDGGI